MSNSSIQHIDPAHLAELRERRELHSFDPLPVLQRQAAAGEMMKERERARNLLTAVVSCTRELLTLQVRLTADERRGVGCAAANRCTQSPGAQGVRCTGSRRYRGGACIHRKRARNCIRTWQKWLSSRTM